MKNKMYKLSDNIFVVSDFEIVKYNLLGVNKFNLNYFLELFSSDPDNMSNSKYISKFNNFLNEKNSFIFESVEKGKIKGVCRAIQPDFKTVEMFDQAGNGKRI